MAEEGGISTAALDQWYKALPVKDTLLPYSNSERVSWSTHNKLNLVLAGLGLPITDAFAAGIRRKARKQRDGLYPPYVVDPRWVFR